VGGVSEESEERYPRYGREGRRPANKPVVKVSGLELQPEDSARRCKSKGRGSVYNPVFGISCHYCRFCL
jgi:hypothetical protein